ncbi:MAG: AAA family ATPase [Candidatus Eisenbacteria bacterium]
MRITRIRMKNFRSFADFEVRLDPRLNLIVGTNESGKSTVVEALAVALFADPASRSRGVRELERWGTTSATRLELSFEHAGVSYELMKDFGEGRVELRDMSSGRVMGDRSEVDRLVQGMVGFATRDAFESVAAVRQGELAILEDKKTRRGELVPLIERKMTSSSGVIDAASVVERLGKEAARMRAGVDRPAPKNPGPLSQCREKIEDYSRRIAAHQATWASVVRTMGELSGDRESLEKRSAELAKLEKAVRTEEKSRDLALRLSELDDALEEREAKIGKIRKLRKDIEEAWERIGGTAYGEEKRAIVTAKADLDASERHVKELVESAPGWAGEGADRRAAVATGAAGLVTFVLLLVVAAGAFPGARLWLLLSGVAAAAGTAFLFRRTLRIWAFSRTLRVAGTERHRRATILTASLSTLSFPNYLEFEHKVEEYDRAQRDAESSRAVLMDVCGTEDPGRVEEALESETTSLGRQRRVLEDELKELPTSTAMGESELAKLRAERDTLGEGVASLTESIARHEWELGKRETEESLPDLEARLEIARTEEQELERRVRVLDLAREGLDTALGSTKEAAASVLEPIVERILARVTLGRYTDVQVGKDLGLTVGNAIPSTGGPARVEADDLSTGTVDQLYLAIRYALLEFLSTHDGAPFILDDALVNSDPDRRSAALELLHEISEERQVIMLSCENHGFEFADEVIALPGITGSRERSLMSSGGIA